jgi:hypothetical protein
VEPQFIQVMNMKLLQIKSNENHGHYAKYDERTIFRSPAISICDSVERLGIKFWCRPSIRKAFFKTKLRFSDSIKQLDKSTRQNAEPFEMTNRKMTGSQFGLVVSLMQRKSTELIRILRHILTEEFQHCGESQLIEVMKIKMHLIQFVLIVNQIWDDTYQWTCGITASKAGRAMVWCATKSRQGSHLPKWWSNEWRGWSPCKCFPGVCQWSHRMGSLSIIL